MSRRVEGFLHSPPPVIRPLSAALSAAYGLGTAAHGWIYRWGLLPTRTLPRPVVSVGNITAGGGGKTPVVRWLTGALRRYGLRPAVLSRGYGRRRSDARLVGRGDTWTTVGDEPMMLASALEGVPVAVAPKRYDAGMKVLETADVDLFILDDGFQHRSLFRDLDIVVVSDGLRLGSGRLLPAGPLREPPGRLRDADFVVVTGAAEPDRAFEETLKGYGARTVLWMDLVPASPRLLPGRPPSAAEGDGGPFLAFCGIARPEGFLRTLKRAGIEVTGLLAFPDHHPYTTKDVKRVLRRAGETGAEALITTEKDAVRWPSHEVGIRTFSLPVRVEPHGGAEDLLDRLASLVLPVAEAVRQ